MPPESHRRPIALALAASVVTAHAASAEPNRDGAAAQALFEQAQQLMAAGRPAEACPKLEESQRLDPAGGTLLNLGKCYEVTGRLASAWNAYLEAAASSRASGHTAREAAARALAAEIASRVPRLRIRLGANRDLGGLVVRRDSRVVGSPQWDAAIAVDPGPHRVTVEAPGRELFAEEVVLGDEGDTVEVVIPPLEPLSATAADSEPAGLGAQRSLALAAGGVGVVAVGFGTFFGLRSLSKRNAAEKFCDGAACRTQEGFDLRQDARAAGDLSTIGFIVGVAGVAGGAALWFTASDPRSEGTVSVGVGPRAVLLRGAF